MNFSQFCKNIYPHVTGITSQGWFVGALFVAAGSTYFPERPIYGADAYQGKIYRNEKPLTQSLKDSFPKPINLEKLNSFFKARIGVASLSQIMSKFGIPSVEMQNKELFISALCKQFDCIVSDAANDVDDIVMTEYIRSLREPDSTGVDVSPLYPGDDILLVSELPAQRHIAGFYETFTHAWEIKNDGTVTWEGRRLECIDQAETRIRAKDTVIGIPKVKPGESVVIEVQFNARGFEGDHESIWIMKDSNGRFCFPDECKALKLVATVVNGQSAPSEV